jgi:lipoyl(octanoyl) transferase
MSIDRRDSRQATAAARRVGGGDAAVQAYLLGLIDYADCLALQQRLVYETAGRDDGLISLLICEHPAIITIGRQGSRSHVHMSRRELTSRRLELRWVNRGGGCLLHAPGQLAVYPIVPLEWHGFRVGDYLDRLQAGLLAALADLRFQGRTCPRRYGVWGRSGQVAAMGAAVKNWTSYHGAYINVAPAMHVFRRIQSDPEGGTEMTSLLAERRQPVRMSGVREALVRRLSEAFGCARYHLFTGHPLLARPRGATHESAARAG